MPVVPVTPGHAPIDAPAAATQAAAVPPPPAPGAVTAVPPARKTTARATESARPAAAVPAPRLDPEPTASRQAPAPVAASGGNYQAVEQCRDRIFLAKELCLAEQCDKSGTRNHPLCAKRREEARLREDSKQIPR
jgi:eukaryotic-like serine/threonine-protein kinase